MKHERVAVRCRPVGEGDKEFSLVLDEQRVFPAGQLNRRSLFLNGQDSEQIAVNVKGMRHPDPKILGAGRFAHIGIPYPDIMGPFVGTVETICGGLIVLGLFTRLAAIPLIVIMVVAIVST